MSDHLYVLCRHCDTLNRVPRAKLAAGGKCGACHLPLFEGHPLALDSAHFERHLEKSDLPLLIDFWAALVQPLLHEVPEFERARGRLEPSMRLVKINVGENPAVADRFVVRSISTLVLAVHGHELAGTAGAMSAPELES